MPPRDLVIGIDSSTTSCKAVAWDSSGRALASGRAPLSMLKPRPAWHEQESGEWWQATAQALRQVTAQIDPRRLAALSIAAQRETFVVTDLDGHPLDHAWLWMDERCRELLPEIDRLYGQERIHQETGKPLSANLSLGKLYWLRLRRPDLFDRIDRVLDVHAFLSYQMGGRFATSWGCADPMGLFDMRRNAWDADLIEALGYRLDQFPEVLPPGSSIGKVTAKASQQTGLPEGLPLIAGIGDGQAAGLGACAAQPGASYLNLGTAVITGTYSQRYLVDPAFRTMYSGIPGAYNLETVLLGGTYTISWFLDKLAGLQPEDLAPGTVPEELLEAEAARVPPGSAGLILLPYWNSVMNPYWNARASGVVIGWRGMHGREHLYRAILEGIAYELRLHASGVEMATGQPLDRYIAVGGGARSSLWCQILADVTGKRLYRADAPEASALGAGILAAVGAGLHPDIPAASRSMTRVAPEPFQPDARRNAYYSQLYADVYQPIYPSMMDILNRLDILSNQNGLKE